MIFRLLGRASVLLHQSRTLALVGGTSLALALAVAFLPWLVPTALLRPLAVAVGSPATILLFGAVAGLLGAQALRASATGATDESGGGPGHWSPDRPPERAYYDEYRTVGAEIDSAFDADRDGSRDDTARRRSAQSRIRETAISVVAADESVDRETAARRIRDGAWTDDPRAAAFLGGLSHAPLRIRIRDWASGERFERWATHAVAEIEARKRDETANSRPRPSESDGGRDESGREPEVVRR